jgi:hypothetical protein
MGAACKIAHRVCLSKKEPASITCSSCPLNSGYLLVASSECIVSNTCPEGYYLIPNSTNCSSVCGNGLYREPISRTCTSVCPSDNFKTVDLMCSINCPVGYYGNSTYFCVKCVESSSVASGYICPDILNFNISQEIIEDSLYLYLAFSIETILTR